MAHFEYHVDVIDFNYVALWVASFIILFVSFSPRLAACHSTLCLSCFFLSWQSDSGGRAVERVHEKEEYKGIRVVACRRRWLVCGSVFLSVFRLITKLFLVSSHFCRVYRDTQLMVIKYRAF